MKEFFILGSQRSGTTLARLALNAHPNVVVYDEVVGYKYLFSGDREGIPEATTHVGFKIPRFTEQMGYSVLKDTGLDGQMDWEYSNQPIIFMLRDVRDTICSMNGLRTGPESSWLSSYGRMGLKEKLDDPAFCKQYKNDIIKGQQRSWPLASVGALYWKFKTAAVFEYMDRGWPVLPLKYEFLVENPAAALKKTVDFLGLKWSPELLHHHETDHQELLAGGLAVGNTDPKKPINDSSVERWKKELNKDAEECIMEIAGDINSKINMLT